MATTTLIITPSSGGALSTWTGYESGYGEIRYTTPTTDGFMATFAKPAALTGAVLHGVEIAITGSGGSGVTYVRYKGTAISVNNANLLEKLQNGEDNIEVYFSYRATGGSGGEGQHSASYTWSSVVVTVTYTPAGAVNGTISAGGSSAFYSTDRRSLCAPETAPLRLSVTPDKHVSRVTLEMRPASGGSADSFSADVDIAASTTQQIDFTLAITDAVPQSRVEAAYFRVTLVTPDGNEVSAWTQTALKLASSRLSPTVSASFSDISSIYQTFGVYLQGQSSFRCAISATLDTGADADNYIVSRVVEVAGVPIVAGGDAVDVGAVNASGTVLWTVTVTDAYGQTGSASGSLSLTAYAPPALTALAFQRYDPDTQTPDDGSQHIRVTVQGAVSPINSRNAWTLGTEYTNGSVTGRVTLDSASDGAAISHTQDATLFTTLLSDQDDWTITVTLADQLGSSVYTLTVPKAGGIFNIEKTGVAVGMRSTSSAAEHRFESAFKAIFYAGIFDGNGNPIGAVDDTGWQSLTLDNTCTQDSAFATCAYRVKAGIVYLRGAVNLAQSMSSSGTVSRTLLTLPSAARPAQAMIVSAGSRANVSSIEIGADGTVKLWNRIGAAIGTTEAISLTASYPAD